MTLTGRSLHHHPIGYWFCYCRHRHRHWVLLSHLQFCSQYQIFVAVAVPQVLVVVRGTLDGDDDTYRPWTLTKRHCRLL